MSRSRRSPSAMSSSALNSTARAAVPGATCPRARFSTAATVASAAARSNGGTGSWPLRRSGLPISSRANAAASARRSPLAMRSMRPRDSACGAATGLPEVTRSIAAGTPASRGTRCVPPAPGMMPSVTSGRPTRASAVAIRPWAASAISKPPPSAVPWMAATTGLVESSIAWQMSGVTGGTDGLPCSRRSAPAMKVRPAAASTIACTAGSPAARASASIVAMRMPCDVAFTGGLSISMVAMRSVTVKWASSVTGLLCWRIRYSPTKLSIVLSAPASATPSSSCSAALRRRCTHSAASGRPSSRGGGLHDAIELRQAARMRVGIALHQPPRLDQLDGEAIVLGGRSLHPRRAKHPDERLRRRGASVPRRKRFRPASVYSIRNQPIVPVRTRRPRLTHAVERAEQGRAGFDETGRARPAASLPPRPCADACTRSCRRAGPARPPPRGARARTGCRAS